LEKETRIDGCAKRQKRVHKVISWLLIFKESVTEKEKDGSSKINIFFQKL
jgi:hypothetical protein